MIDATNVRTHKHSSDPKKRDLFNQALGCNLGSLSTHIHTKSDARGNSTGFHLNLAITIAMMSKAPTLWSKIPRTNCPCLWRPGQVGSTTAEKRKRGCNSLILHKKQWHEYDWDLYQALHLTANIFACLMQYHAIEMARNFLGVIHLMASVASLN